MNYIHRFARFPDPEILVFFSVKVRHLSEPVKILIIFQVVTQYGARLTLEEAEELLHEADLDGDGKLDYTEFVQMMSWDLDDG
jgi:hypothetical protein